MRTSPELDTYRTTNASDWARAGSIDFSTLGADGFPHPPIPRIDGGTPRGAFTALLRPCCPSGTTSGFSVNACPLTFVASQNFSSIRAYFCCVTKLYDLHYEYRNKHREIEMTDRKAREAANEIRMREDAMADIMGALCYLLHTCKESEIDAAFERIVTMQKDFVSTLKEHRKPRTLAEMCDISP